MTKKFDISCQYLIEKSKGKIQGEKRERWRKFLKKAGLNPDYWNYNAEDNEVELIKPTKD